MRAWLAQSVATHRRVAGAPGGLQGARLGLGLHSIRQDSTRWLMSEVHSGTTTSCEKFQFSARTSMQPSKLSRIWVTAIERGNVQRKCCMSLPKCGKLGLLSLNVQRQMTVLFRWSNAGWCLKRLGRNTIRSASLPPVLYSVQLQ